MSNLSPSEERLRQGFKRYLNPFMRTLWRLGLGKWFKIWPEASGNVLVLTHIGRKTGIQRYQPLNYALDGEDIYCVAGFGGVSDWVRNLKANPNVEVWLPDGWWAGTAEDVSDSPQRVELIRGVLVGSGIVAPLAGVNPHKLTAEQLEAQTRLYRLFRIRRGAARTGPGGPGELEWVWQLATFILLGLLLRRRRR